jgi:hypothetical protein
MLCIKYINHLVLIECFISFKMRNALVTMTIKLSSGRKVRCNTSVDADAKKHKVLAKKHAHLTNVSMHYLPLSKFYY